MITIKPEHFYQFIRNVDKGINGGKNVEMYISNSLIKMKGIHLINACNKMYTSYMNHHFTMKDFCLHILNEMLCRPSEEFLYIPSNWNVENISKVSALFTREQLKKDQEFIIQVSKKTGLDSIEKYYNINSNGESIAFDFLNKRYISPIFIMRYKNSFASEDGFEESEAHKRMRRIIDVMEKIIKQTTII